MRLIILHYFSLKERRDTEKRVKMNLGQVGDKREEFWTKYEIKEWGFVGAELTSC